MLSDKVVVITGAFGTLGRAVVSMAVARGASVAAIDIAPTPPQGLQEQWGKQTAIFGGTDLRNFESAVKVLSAAKAQLGRIDCLVNIAGGFRWETVADGNTAIWDMLYEMNVRTTLHASRAILPYLIEAGGGSIVNIGANGAVNAAEGMGAYAASKSGVHRLTEALAAEMKGRGITVNAVLPSIIDTPVNRADMPTADFTKWVSPDDLANVILFLISDRAKSVTGALIPVTGGA